MPEWIMEHDAEGDVSGGILVDHIVSFSVTNWPDPEDEEEDRLEVGFWLQGDYRIVEPGTAPMSLQMTREEYGSLVERLLFGPRGGAAVASSPQCRPKRNRSRAKPAVLPTPETTEEEKEDDGNGSS